MSDSEEVVSDQESIPSDEDSKKVSAMPFEVADAENAAAA